MNYDHPARKARLNAFCEWLERFPCPYRGRNPTFIEELWWNENVGEWYATHSDEVDMLIACRNKPG